MKTVRVIYRLKRRTWYWLPRDEQNRLRIRDKKRPNDNPITGSWHYKEKAYFKDAWRRITIKYGR